MVLNWQGIRIKYNIQYSFDKPIVKVVWLWAEKPRLSFPGTGF